MADPRCETLNEVVAFCWDRLPLDKGIRDTRPSLAEEWFVEDAIESGSPFRWRGLNADESHAKLYRYATAKAWQRGEYGGHPEWLLLHQMTVVTPILFAKALAIFQETRNAE